LSTQSMQKADLLITLGGMILVNFQWTAVGEYVLERCCEWARYVHLFVLLFSGV
jgi:hypothetical protein